MDHRDTAFVITRGTFPCKWCDKAIQLLTDLDLKFTVRKMSRSDLEAFGAQIGQNTVPMIFHGTKFIGGYDLLEAYVDKPEVSL